MVPNDKVTDVLAEPQHALSQEQLGLCADAIDLLTKNLVKLRDAKSKGEVWDYLRDWAIVLCVLARDVFESTALLLDAGQMRGANMLSRALADYDIRLRYYIVQFYVLHQKYTKRKTKVDLKKKADAVLDFENRNYKLGKVLNLYDPSVWPDEARESLEKVMMSKETERGLTFADMVEYLAKREVKARGLIGRFKEASIDRYKSMRANWRMQSGFLHGDQTILSDVIAFYSDGHKTGEITEKGPHQIKTILFTALNHVCDLMESFEEIHGDASGQAAFFERVARAWRKVHDPKSPES